MGYVLQNPHFKSIASGKGAAGTNWLRELPAPVSGTWNNGGKSTIVAFSEATPEGAGHCLRCHSQTLSRANIRRSRTRKTAWFARIAI
jgi:hypothetical protein